MNVDDLELVELIRLQARISEVLTRRFEQPLALAFSDVVGSSEYTARTGDEAGRVLQQRHLDLVSQQVQAHGGRIVDTAGDGAFCVFPTIDAAIAGIAGLHRAVQADNQSRAEEQRLSIRTGVHFARVLTDGTIVSGDGVNFCARVAASASPGELRLTRAAFHELGSAERACCKALALVTLKGFGEGIPVFAYEWRDPSRFPVAVRVVETGAEHVLPDKPVVTLGRLRTTPAGAPANDIVLALPDAEKAVLISRWHVELRRRDEGMVIRLVSDSSAELNGQPLAKGVDVPVRTGDTARIAAVLTLAFVGESLSRSALSTRDSSRT